MPRFIDGRRLTKKDHRMVAFWNPDDRDVWVDLTPRIGNADTGWLLWTMFNKENVAELEKRGFDLSSMRFHIDKSLEGIKTHERIMKRA